MIFLRLWFWILLALALGAGRVSAASSAETRAFAAAAAAFKTEMWSRAETELAQFIQKYPASSSLPEALLLQGQAAFQQGKYPEAAALFAAGRPKAGKLADQYEYWTAQSQFQSGNHEAAAETFAALGRNYPKTPLRLRALVEEAAARSVLGKWEEVESLLLAKGGIFQRASLADSANEIVQRGQLLLAQARFELRDSAGASALLNRAGQHALPVALDWQRLYLLCRMQLADGKLAEALSSATNMTLAARKQNHPARLAESVAIFSTVLEKSGRLPEAASAWADNLSTNAPIEQQQQAILKIAALAAQQNDFTSAEAALEKYTARFQSSPAMDLAVLTLGEIKLKAFAAAPASTNLLAAAQAYFDTLLALDTNGPLSGKAFLNRGWIFWRAGKTAESLADFQSAARRLSSSEDLAVARFKAGDAAFALKDFEAARGYYQSVLTDFSAFPEVERSLAGRALYQLLRVSLELRDGDSAGRAMQRLLNEFKADAQVPSSLLLVGEGLSDFGDPAKAREVFEQFAGRFPESPLRAQVDFSAARTFERQQKWPEAIAAYGQWLKNHPTNALAPQVEYACALANFRSGNETNALAGFSGFLANHPTNSLAPLAQWWVADYCFRSGNFTGAETNYEHVFQNPAWKNSDVYYPAQLMAGRAAMARQGFQDAGRYFAVLISDTNCSPALATQARFAYGAALMQMPGTATNNPSLQLATNIFSQISQMHPNDERGAAAWNEFGDCCLQLGDFAAATNAYAHVLNAPAAGPALRSRAQVGIGIVLEILAEKMQAHASQPLLKQALGNYLDVLYGVNLRDGEQADLFWVKKAGLQALPLVVRLKEGNVDRFFDRLEELLPPMKETLEKKRAALGVDKN